VAYDLVAEGRRVLADGMPEPPARLSRRHRLIVLAADADGGAAAVLFARRGVSGQPNFEVIAFQRARGGWEPVGGSGGSAEDDLLTDRPPAAELGAALRWEGGGSCRGGRGAPLRLGRSLHHVQIRAAAETAQVRVRGVHGERTLRVQRHGQLVVVWRGSAAPWLVPCSADGSRIGPEISVTSSGW
jgi:hypothetical protein